MISQFTTADATVIKTVWYLKDRQYRTMEQNKKYRNKFKDLW